MSLRIQKVLSRVGIASRRNIERMIQEKRIEVNGEIIKKLGFLINIENDTVLIDKQQVLISEYYQQESIYYVINKPYGVISSTKDEHNRLCVIDLIKANKGFRIYSVGRLDYDAEGVLLLTNDGALANKLLHPSNSIKRVYSVKVKGFPCQYELNKIKKIFSLQYSKQHTLSVLIKKTTKKNTWFKVVLYRGQNKQIKHMFWRIKHPVIKIIRVSFAGINVSGLSPGEYRFLTNLEILKLKKRVHIIS